ncbi:MAG: ATP-grasp domain-containing protein [Thermoleophilia bacterium]|nr:ATP-grasp domain-containing protein [Thermoleophilia bacterium]
MALLLAGRLTPTNVALLDAFRAVDPTASLLPLEDAVRRARQGDTVLARLDVLPTLDGIEPGLRDLEALARRGVQVVNPAGAILTAHDKLATAIKLRTAGVPHPRTAHVGDEGLLTPLDYPVVVKPRFGSWGRDVVRCHDECELAATIAEFSSRPWFRRQGALVQELVPPLGYDLRILVARGQVVGAIQRVSAPGEWRTNIALGGRRLPIVPPAEACATAIEAAATIGGGLLGVDLLPTRYGYTVIELNGCVDFTFEYSLPGEDVFLEVARALRPVPVAALAAVEALPGGE